MVDYDKQAKKLLKNIYYGQIGKKFNCFGISGVALKSYMSKL